MDGTALIMKQLEMMNGRLEEIDRVVLSRFGAAPLIA